MAKTYGTFTKDGETRVATDAGEAVSLRFNGWAEQQESTTTEPQQSKTTAKS